MNENIGLVDKRAYLQVLGCLIKDSTLIDDIDRPLDKKDFWSGKEKLYQLIYVSIYNLHMQGCQVIDGFAIDSYLSNYKDQYKTFQENNGVNYIEDAAEMAELENYDMYYHIVRKLSLLRYYENKGLDTRFIYDTTKAEPSEQNIERQKFDNYTEQDIVGMIEATFVLEPNSMYCTSDLSRGCQAAQGMRERIAELQKEPDIGPPLNNIGINTLVRGARSGCLYMRSLLQGKGKSRLAMADAATLSVPYVYNTKKKEWEFTGWSEPTLYIATEQKLEELQSMLNSAVSKVPESHILMNQYEDGEVDRVEQAIDYIEAAPLYLEEIFDFTITDILNLIKKYNRIYGVKYVFFDYIWLSVRAMGEANKTARMGLKENQLLLSFSTELKALAQKLDIFIFTASQMNGEAKDAKIKDQNLLAGAKALSNKLDFGMIQMAPTAAEKKKLEAIIHHKVGLHMPNMGSWCYKIRGGQLSSIIVWSDVDLGTMTETPLFCTNFDMELVDVDFTKIESVEKVIQENSRAITTEDLEETHEEESEDNEIKQKANFDW